MALLVFLSRPAGARIIAADFFAGTYDLLHRLLLSATGHARLLELAFFLAPELRFDLIDGGGNSARRLTIATDLQRALLGRRTQWRILRPLRLRPFNDLHQIQIPDRV